jgi:hypothetical protein
VSSYSNPSILQTQLRVQYTPGQTPGVVTQDSQPLWSTFASPSSATDTKCYIQDIALPSTAVSTAVSVPALWTAQKLTVVNLDSSRGVQLVTASTTTTASPFFLPPNGGTFSVDYWYGAISLTTAPTTIWLTGLASTGTTPAGGPVQVRIIVAGWQ